MKVVPACGYEHGSASRLGALLNHAAAGSLEDAERSRFAPKSIALMKKGCVLAPPLAAAVMAAEASRRQSKQSVSQVF
jgi:hypothetical protein